MAEHFCQEHQAVWFKKGAMRGYAHPILNEAGEQEYNEDGKLLWCNETNTGDVSRPEKPPASPLPKEIDKPNMSKEDWREKDKTTRKSIERQTSLNAAVELAKLAPSKASVIFVIEIAKVFEAYLDGKEVQPRESTMVSEAKKLGAKEIKEGGIDKQP